MGRFLFKWLNKINYYGGFGTTLAAVAAFITLLFIVAQTCSLQNQVKLTQDQLKVTEKSLEITLRQLEASLMVTRPFLNPKPVFNIDEDKGGICYDIANTGSIPARIIFLDFLLWLDGKSIPKKEVPNPSLSIIYPNHPYISQCGVLTPKKGLNTNQILKFLYDMKSCVEFSTCIIYESIDKKDHRRWQVDIRNTTGELGKFPTIHADENMISKEVTQCQIGPPHGCKEQ